MKYMIMTFGDAAPMLETKSREWIKDMIQFMTDLDVELHESGELVDAQGLTDSTTATTVRFIDGAPVPTDGPYAETGEALIGYWLLDVENEERAVAIASRISAAAQAPIEVRQVADAPPEV